MTDEFNYFISRPLFIFTIIIMMFIFSLLSLKYFYIKNGIVIQTSQGIFDNNGFEEKRIFIQDDNDLNYTYIFCFKPEEAPEVTLGQMMQFSVVKSKRYLNINDKKFVPYMVMKQRL